MRFLHTGDWHLGQCLYGKTDPDGVKARLKDQGRTVLGICHSGVEAEVDAFFFAGDLFRDPKPDPTSIVLAQRAFQAVQAAGIPVVMVPGNHDDGGVEGESTALCPFADEGITVLRHPCVHVVTGRDGLPLCQVVAVPYFRRSYLLANNPGLTREQADNLCAELSATMIDGLLAQAVQADLGVPIIGLVHHNIEGSVLSGGYETAGQGDPFVSLRALDREQFAFVACGHIHKHQRIAGASRPVWYSGSAHALDFGEEKDPKGFLLVTLGDEGQLIDLHFERTQGRRFVTYDLDFTEEANPGDLRPLRNQLHLKDYAATAIVRVRYTCRRDQRPAINDAEILSLLEQAGAWHVHSIAATLTDAGQVLRVEGLTSTGVSPHEAVERYIDSKPDFQAQREPLLAKFSQLFTEVTTNVRAA